MLDRNKREIVVGNKVRFNPFSNVEAEGIVVELITKDDVESVRIECRLPGETSAIYWNRYPQNVMLHLSMEEEAKLRKDLLALENKK